MFRLPLADLMAAPTIDVHGYDVHGAIFEIDAFCERAWAKREPAVRIMHGRGQGVLRAGILRWVKTQGHLVAEDSPLPFETGAVLYLCLRTH